MNRSELHSLQVIAVAYLPSTWLLSQQLHRINLGNVEHSDAALLSLQFQWRNLWIPLHLHKHKSPYKKPTQVSNPERDRKDEKADEQAWSSRSFLSVSVLRQSVGYSTSVCTAEECLGVQLIPGTLCTEHSTIGCQAASYGQTVWAVFLQKYSLKVHP